MNREEFLNRLEMLLDSLPKEESEEALQYYRDYFDDAGVENEQKVIGELESPEKVAAIIRSGMESGSDDYFEYGETGYTDTRYEEKKVPESRVQREEEQHRKSDYEYADTSNTKKEPWTSDIVKVVLVIAIIVVAIPTVGPILLGLAAAFFGIFIGLVVAGITLTIVGVSLAVAGIIKLVTLASGGILMSGAGLILLALGLLLTVFMIKAAGKVIPPVCRWMIDLIRRPFHRKAV